MSELNNQQKELAALAAAIASNCVPCIEFHIPEARKVGLSDAQIKQAVQIADRVRRVPAREVLRTALARIQPSPTPVDDMGEAGCGCAAPSRSDVTS